MAPGTADEAIVEMRAEERRGASARRDGESIGIADRGECVDEPRAGEIGRTRDRRRRILEQIRDVVSTIDYAAAALGSRLRLLVGQRGQARITLAAAALRVDVDEVLVDASEFETGESGFFLPSFLRAGGLAALFSLICPRPLTLINAPDDLLQLARSAYREHAGSLRETEESVGSLLMSTLAAVR